MFVQWVTRLSVAEGQHGILQAPSHTYPPQLHELVEQEYKVHTAMMNRTGLLALMFHQATQHDPLTTDLRSRVDS